VIQFFCFSCQNSLTSMIPESIGSATSLEILYLFSNALSGPIPSEVGLLAKLLDLQLYENNLTSTIPDNIGSATSLEILNLDSNALTGPIPSTVGHLTKLRHLTLFDNNLTGTIPESIGSAISMELLYLYSNALLGPIPSTVGLLTKLQGLSLSDNILTGTIFATTNDECNNTTDNSMQQLVRAPEDKHQQSNIPYRSPVRFRLDVDRFPWKIVDAFRRSAARCILWLFFCDA
jgi:Leucine-rich repeat (LRR) protein